MIYSLHLVYSLEADDHECLPGHQFFFLPPCSLSPPSLSQLFIEPGTEDVGVKRQVHICSGKRETEQIMNHNRSKCPEIESAPHPRPLTFALVDMSLCPQSISRKKSNTELMVFLPHSSCPYCQSWWDHYPCLFATTQWMVHWTRVLGRMWFVFLETYRELWC